MTTVESRKFWASAEKRALEIQQWPSWKRAGINVQQFRTNAAHTHNNKR